MHRPSKQQYNAFYKKEDGGSERKGCSSSIECENNYCANVLVLSRVVEQKYLHPLIFDFFFFLLLILAPAGGFNLAEP